MHTTLNDVSDGNVSRRSEYIIKGRLNIKQISEKQTRQN